MIVVGKIGRTLEKGAACSYYSSCARLVSGAQMIEIIRPSNGNSDMIKAWPLRPHRRA